MTYERPKTSATPRGEWSSNQASNPGWLAHIGVRQRLHFYVSDP